MCSHWHWQVLRGKATLHIRELVGMQCVQGQCEAVGWPDEIVVLQEDDMHMFEVPEGNATA